MTQAPQILPDHRLRSLRLPKVLREYGKLARQCATEGHDHVQFLARLVELEMIARERRMIERRIKAAKFPSVKSPPRAGMRCRTADELGFVPLNKTGAALLFELIPQRDERGVTLITSNLPFDEWTKTFGSERLTGALLDRRTHHVNILEMNGESHRLSQRKARQNKA